MKHLGLTFPAPVLLVAGPSLAHGQGAGSEWDTLNQEAIELHRVGKYDRAALVAQKALEATERNAGHFDVATSLNSLAETYNTQGAYAKAEPLFKRAAVSGDGPDKIRGWNELKQLTEQDDPLMIAEVFGDVGILGAFVGSINT